MSDDHVVPSVAPEQVQDLLAQGWTLVDVRTDEEWAEGHIAGSKHLSMNQVTQRLGEMGNQVICVCAAGGRSWRVTEYLTLQGVDAANLEGGLQAWVAAGYPVEH